MRSGNSTTEEVLEGFLGLSPPNPWGSTQYHRVQHWGNNKKVTVLEDIPFPCTVSWAGAGLAWAGAGC